MRLVFITRKVDRADTRTSFVFSWLEKLSQNLETLYVICQEKGDTSGLPDNVEVHSFGKDRGHGRFRQLFYLLFLIFKFSKNSKGIFAHMMPIYAVVAWLPAKLTGNKIVLWYTHKSVNLRLRIATALVDKVLTASKESFRLDSPKVNVVGHGIPIEKFKSRNPKPKSTNENLKFRIVSIGRISRVKDYESLIKAVQILVSQERIKDIQCDIYGDPALQEDFSYLQSLQEFVKNAELENVVSFKGGVEYTEVPEIYQSSDLFVNLSKTGSLDKTVLEAAVSGILVLTSNEAFRKPLEKISSLLFYDRNDPKELAHDILELKVLAEGDKEVLRKKLQDWVTRDHNLTKLVEKIITGFTI